jgi:hypothetical protein
MVLNLKLIRNNMREFLQAINDYPWTTFFVVISLAAIGNVSSNKNK